MHAQGRKAPQRKKKKRYTVVSQSAPQQDEMVQDRSNNQDADDYNVNIDNDKSSGESSMEVEYNEDNISP